MDDIDSIDIDITPREQGGLIILEATCIEENINIVEREIMKVLMKIH